jgi:FtsP/CotA-like multicopper oxidase with cupredoxin domain
LINAAAATIYRVALHGHRLTVTHTDGQAVEPVTVDVLRIGMGERYDVLVNANNPGLWQLATLVEGTQRMGRAVVRYAGNRSALPPADFQPPELKRQMLTYAMLKAAPGTFVPPADTPDQTIPILLSGGMGQYVWRMNNQVSQHADRISVQENRLIRFQFHNQSRMPHPMHLHGHFFQLDNGTGRGPLKDTVLVDPMQQMTVNWISDNPGSWAFHCHNVYHQDAGMMRVVQVHK